MEIQPAHYTAGACHSAQGDRLVLSSVACSEGVATRDDLRVTAGTGMSVEVAGGGAFVEGDSVACQGMYHVYNCDPVVLSIGSADPTDDRIDRVVARVRDAQFSGSDNDWILEVIPGNASPAPAPPALPASAYTLALVTVAAGSTTVDNVNISDQRELYLACGGGESALITFTANGTFDPDLYPTAKAFKVTAVGGGGGSGGSQNGTGQASTSGGGGGSTAITLIHAEELTGPVAVTVGAGGALGAGGGSSNGSTGGTSSFGTWAVAPGGGGGSGMAPTSGSAFGNPGNGGVATVGDILIEGSDGGVGTVSSGFGFINGDGGSSHMGGGSRAVSNVSSGSPGSNYGGGAGGVRSQGASNFHGSNGGPGIVIVEVL